MRADVVIDCMQKPGSRHALTDENNPRQSVSLIEVVYSGEGPLRDSPLTAPIALESNLIPEPDLILAQRRQVLFEGGAMGALREGDHFLRNSLQSSADPTQCCSTTRPMRKISVRSQRTCS
jgi:hypothetical protein